MIFFAFLRKFREIINDFFFIWFFILETSFFNLILLGKLKIGDDFILIMRK